MKKKINSTQVLLVIVAAILLIWSLTLIFPFVWALLNSLKTSEEYIESTFALPKNWLFSNWVKAMTVLSVRKETYEYLTANLGEMFGNSIWFAVGGSVLEIFFTTLFAYVLAKYRFSGNRFLFALSVTVMMIPIVGALPSQYRMIYRLGLNNPAFLVTCCTAIGSATFLILYSYFKGVSWTYAEAVLIDGGGHWAIYFRVMLPMAMPIVTAMLITTCIGRWNDYLTPILYLGDYPTVAAGIWKMYTEGSTEGNKPIYFAAILTSAIPVFVTFCIFSEKIMNNVSIGGIKG